MIKVVAAVIEQKGCILLAQRPLNKHQGGKWEFPGGKVEPEETNIQALYRECEEELGITLASPQLLDSILYHYEDKTVHIQFFRVREFCGTPKGEEGQQVKWFAKPELNSLTFPDANQKIVQKLLLESSS